MLIATRLSTIKFVTGVISDLVTNHPSSIPIVYQDWDAHADLQELPDADLVGLNGFGITEQDKMHEIVFGITICTYNDPNVFRLAEYADEFYRRMRSQKQFKIYHPQTAAEVGVATFETGTTVTPVARVEVRPTMSISGSALIAMRAGFHEL